MAPMKHTPDEHQSQEELALYSSLCLLEAPTGDGAKLVELSRTMFRKPNIKSFEYIICHCHSVVNGKAATKKSLKWPYADKEPKQKKEFYTNATAWLKETGTLEAYGNSLESFKRNPTGPRPVSFLLDLATYALGVQQERMFPEDVAPCSDLQDDKLLAMLSEPLITAAKAQNQLQTQRLLKAFKAGSDMQQQAEQSAGHMSDLYYSLKAQLAQAQTQAHICRAAAAAGQQLPYPPEETSASNSAGQLDMYLPEELIQQYSELEQMWGELEQHMQLYDGLTQLVDGLSGADIHPHAIDAFKLRQCGQLAPSTAGLDIAGLMEAWLSDVGRMCECIMDLAGQPHGPLASSSLRQGQSSSLTALLATSDASSHAPHLYAQLALHRSCLDHMKGMKTALANSMAAIAERIQQLEEEVYSQIEKEHQASDAAMQQALMLPAGEQPFEFAQLQSHQQAPPAGPHGVTAGLFKSSNLPLIPPTPMLQQLVQKNRTANQQPEAPAASGAAADFTKQQVPRLSFGDAVQEQPSNSSTPRMPGAAPAACEPVSPASSMGSAGRPAPELLFSQEAGVEDPDLDDLDLIDLDGDDEHIYRPSSPVPGQGRQNAGISDLDFLRVSVFELPFGSRAAAGAAQQPAGQQGHNPAAVVESAAPGSISSKPLGFTWFNNQHTSDLQLGKLTVGSDADTPPHIGAHPQSEAAEAAQQPSMEVADAVTLRQQGPAGSTASIASAVGSAAASAVESDDSSPAIAEQRGPLAHPMVPMSAPDSDCFSTARPRRLTFAAAATSGDAYGSVTANSSKKDMSPSSSEVSSDSPGGIGKLDQSEPVQQTGHSLLQLRQRFAAVKQQ